MNGLATHMAFPRGAIVFSQGLAPASLFVVCEGQLQLSMTSPAGRALFLGLAGPGDTLGLSAIINNVPYEITAEAVRPTVAKSVSRAEFLDFMRSHAEVAMLAAQALAKECRALLHETRRLALPGTARGRLAQLILDWAGSAEGNDAKPLIPVAYTHEQIAMMIAATRETVTRLINGFEQQGLIRRQGNSLEILKPQTLKRLIYANGAGANGNALRAKAAQRDGTALRG